MASQPLTGMTPEEYLELDRKSEWKHEFYRGQVYAMAGGSRAHSFVINNIQVALTIGIGDRDCGVFQSDLRVCVGRQRLWTYPDVTVVCGPTETIEGDPETVTNPALIVEVLSPSTANFDCTGKSITYRASRTLRELLLVEPDEVLVEHSWKLPNGHWEMEIVTDLSAILTLSSLDIELPVAQIYRRMDFLSRS